MSAGDELRRSRLRLAGYLVGLLAIGAVVAGLVVAVVLSLGGDGDPRGERRGGHASSPVRQSPRGRPCSGSDTPGLKGTALAQGNVDLRPTNGEGSGTVKAVCLEGELQLLITARNLPGPERVEVWLYNSRRDARSLGAQQTFGSNFFLGRAPVPRSVDVGRYRAIDLSAEPYADTDRRHSGRSLLRGSLRAG